MWLSYFRGPEMDVLCLSEWKQNNKTIFRSNSCTSTCTRFFSLMVAHVSWNGITFLARWLVPAFQWNVLFCKFVLMVQIWQWNDMTFRPAVGSITSILWCLINWALQYQYAASKHGIACRLSEVSSQLSKDPHRCKYILQLPFDQKTTKTGKPKLAWSGIAFWNGIMTSPSVEHFNSKRKRNTQNG